MSLSDRFFSTSHAASLLYHFIFPSFLYYSMAHPQLPISSIDAHGVADPVGVLVAVGVAIGVGVAPGHGVVQSGRDTLGQ